MSFTYEKIGFLDKGIDGKDEYIKVTADGAIDYKVLREEIENQYFRECSHPGSYFCTSMRIHKDEWFDDECIVVVQHRYDI